MGGHSRWVDCFGFKNVDNDLWQDTAGFLARLKKNNVAKASYSQLRLILGDGGEGLGQLTGIDLTQPDDGRWRC